MSFPSTQWSLLAQASGETLEGRKAMETLCGRYWAAVHSFIRSRQIPDAEAQDLTQDFMLHLLQKSFFARGERVRGRFRSFLLGALVRFLADASDKRQALKRGGTAPHFSLDTLNSHPADAHFSMPDAAEAFDREWALTILEAALAQVRDSYTTNGRAALFATLEQFLPGATATPCYEEAARQASLSPAAFKSEVHRVRKRFRAAVRDEVAQTVSAPHEVESELAYLQRVLMGSSDDSFAGGNFGGRTPE